MLTRVVARLCRVPAARKLIWKTWYQFLASYYRGRDWSFMNYGYEPLDPDSPRPRLDRAHEGDRCCIQLYHHVAGPGDLRGKHVLEVGSGRGGGAAFIHRHFRPSRMVGVDFSRRAVSLARAAHRGEGLDFVHGDAENLPFAPCTFDAVVNVESSHCYGSLDGFFGQVRRVLKEGGSFLYADLYDHGEVEPARQALDDSGLEKVSETDITPNVLAALRRDHARKEEMIRRLIPRPLVRTVMDFAGLVGSTSYEAFASGERLYFSFVLRKRDAR